MLEKICYKKIKTKKKDVIKKLKTEKCIKYYLKNKQNIFLKVNSLDLSVCLVLYLEAFPSDSFGSLGVF